MAKNNLTDKQSHTLALILSDVERGLHGVHYHFVPGRIGIIQPRSRAASLLPTLRGLQRAGWITIVCDNPKDYKLTLTDASKAEIKTPAGLDYLASLDTGRAALEPASVGVGESETVANLRQALHEAATGQTEPVATLWDGVYDARSDVPRAEYDDLVARLARAEAALKSARDSLLDIRDLAKPYEDNDNFMFSRIVSHAEYGLSQSEGIIDEVLAANGE